jgi:hypothetical protein
MTHGVFCLIDENHFLITSERIPSMQKLRLGQPVSEVLEDGYAYRPGLEAMIQHARVAKSQAQKASLSTNALDDAVQSALKVVQQPVDANAYMLEIRNLRKAIRSLDIPAARHRVLNWFPRKSE